MSGRHLGIFSGKMPERHVKISYADTSALFSERPVKMSGRHCFPQDSERHVQMSAGHPGPFFRQNGCEKC